MDENGEEEEEEEEEEAIWAELKLQELRKGEMCGGYGAPPHKNRLVQK